MVRYAEPKHAAAQQQEPKQPDPATAWRDYGTISEANLVNVIFFVGKDDALAGRN